MTQAIVEAKNGNTPAELIRLAVNSNGTTDLSKLKELLEIQKDWEANEARKAYHKAMAAFKADPPKIKKDKKVGFSGAGGAKVGYAHASLGNVTESINGKLSKHGLSAGWSTMQKGPEISVTTRITHELGHSEETTLTATADNSGAKNSIQAIGSTITYLERYGLLALTGLATFDQDDDGQAASTELITEKELSQLRDICADREVDEAKFCEYLGVESLTKLPKAKYQQALAAAKMKKKKGENASA